MGKVAGAALTVAAPEAKAARATAGAGRRRRHVAADPRVSAPGSTAAKQREAIEQIKASRPPEPTPEPAQAPASPAPTSPGTGPSVPGGAAASTGSGFLLGVIAWALALNYLQGGPAQVRKFVVAKLFNKV